MQVDGFLIGSNRRFSLDEHIHFFLLFVFIVVCFLRSSQPTVNDRDTDVLTLQRIANEVHPVLGPFDVPIVDFRERHAMLTNALAGQKH